MKSQMLEIQVQLNQLPINDLLAQVSTLKTELRSLNSTMNALNLAAFVQQVSAINNKIDAANSEAQLVASSLQETKSQVLSLLPQVGTIQKAVLRWQQYNATLWSNLLSWSAGFTSTCLCLSFSFSRVISHDEWNDFSAVWCVRFVFCIAYFLFRSFPRPQRIQ